MRGSGLRLRGRLRARRGDARAVDAREISRHGRVLAAIRRRPLHRPVFTPGRVVAGGAQFGNKVGIRRVGPSDSST